MTIAARLVVLLASCCIFGMEQSTFHGKVKGDVESFLGIPFATAGRWEAPQPIFHPYVVNAKDFGPCPRQIARQVSVFQSTFNAPRSEPSEGHELNLNIYRPRNLDTKAPVLVYLYQGDFSAGSNSELGNDPSGFAAASGSIVVVPNYRLGILGWACHPALPAGCNLGLRDAIEALRWVKKYISSFGGDATNITLMGHSAGGIIGLHLMAILARPEYLAECLVHKFVIASANHAMIPTKDADSASRYFEELAKTLGCESVVELMAKEEHDLTSKFRRLFGPTVDGDLIKSDLRSLLKRGALLKLPVLLTSVPDDGSMMVPAGVRQLPAAHFAGFLSQFLTCAPASVIPHYPADGAHIIMPAASKLVTEALFHAPMLWVQKTLSARGIPVKCVLWAAEDCASSHFPVLEGGVRDGEQLPGTDGLGSFHYTDILSLFGPVCSNPRLQIPAEASTHTRQVYSAFLQKGIEAVEEVPPQLSDEIYQLWMGPETGLPVNWIAAGLQL